MIVISADHFTRVTGPPQQDDLERANCPEAGKIGHWGCGWCEHDRPRWMCMACFREENESGHHP